MLLLTRTFGPESDRGNDFYDRISPPWKDELLHKKFLSNIDVSATKLQQSYGHTAMTKSSDVFKVTCLEDFAPLSQRMRELEGKFDKLNDADMTVSQRMSLGESSLPPGLALVVRKGEGDEPAHILFISTPVLTRPDVNDVGLLGAPVSACDG